MSKHDCDTSEPTNCVCDECGVIFIGEPLDDLCAICCELYDKYGNPKSGDRIINCCFPDCGCDGARLCMAENGSNAASMNMNFERGTWTP